MAGEGEKKKEEERKRCCLQRSHGTTRQWWYCEGRDPHPTRAQERSGLLVLPPGRHNLIQGGSQSACFPYMVGRSGTLSRLHFKLGAG